MKKSIQELSDEFLAEEQEPEDCTWLDGAVWAYERLGFLNEPYKDISRLSTEDLKRIKDKLREDRYGRQEI